MASVLILTSTLLHVQQFDEHKERERDLFNHADFVPVQVTQCGITMDAWIWVVCRRENDMKEEVLLMLMLLVLFARKINSKLSVGFVTGTNR